MTLSLENMSWPWSQPNQSALELVGPDRLWFAVGAGSQPPWQFARKNSSGATGAKRKKLLLPNKLAFPEVQDGWASGHPHNRTGVGGGRTHPPTTHRDSEIPIRPGTQGLSWKGTGPPLIKREIRGHPLQKSRPAWCQAK